jgi:NAD(P)-dependent dehydrogenase (short-subunit alcohol dehydrogenase family)
VIHVAGIWHDDQAAFRKDLEDYSDAQIADAMNVGLTGFMILLSRLLPKMPRDSTIIGVSGTFADGASGWLPYYTSKRGLEDMLVGLSQDYPNGPQVFGVSPADTATKAYEKFFPQYVDEAQPADVVAKEVSRLLAKPDVVTGTIIELRDSKTRPGFHR